MKKIITLLLVATLWSCVDNDNVELPKHPTVDEITDKPILAGSVLTITGSDLDDNPTFIFNEEKIVPTSIKSSSVTLKIPEDATSGKLEIMFKQEAYNTQFYLKILDEGWSSYKASSYYQVDFVTPQVGYAKKRVVDTDYIDKTTDGGANWSTVLKVPVPTSIIEATSANVVYIRTTSNVIKKTEDGGINWKDVEVLDLSYLIQKLVFSNDLEGYLFADKFGKVYVFKTIDGGVSWNEVLEIGATSVSQIKILFHKNAEMHILNNDTLYTTTDFGDNWSTRSFNKALSDRLSATYFLNKDKAWTYVVGIESGLLETDDAFQNWEFVDFPKFPERVVQIVFFDEQNGYLLTENGGVYYINNEEKTWKLLHLDVTTITSVTHIGNKLFVVAGGNLLTKSIN